MPHSHPQINKKNLALTPPSPLLRGHPAAANGATTPSSRSGDPPAPPAVACLHPPSQHPEPPSRAGATVIRSPSRTAAPPRARRSGGPLRCSTVVILLHPVRVRLHGRRGGGEEGEGRMEYCYGRDFLFCELCGTQLLLSSTKFAQCPHCRFKRPAREMEGKEIRYTVSAEDIRRELNIESFVQTGTVAVQEELQRPIANKICPDCGHNELEYYTKQLRSADEGATTFYECRKCKKGFREQ